MLARKDQERDPIFMPDEWRKELINLLYDTYEEQCLEKNKKFDAYAMTYPDELVLAITLIDIEDDAVLPITYIASADLLKEADQENTLNSLVDSIGIFFDHYFAQEEWDEYDSNWTEAEYKGMRFYYTITRENPALTIEADRLLRKQ